MKYLFIHQNLPGQYLHLIQRLRDVPGNEVVGVGQSENIRRRGSVKDITTLGYPEPQPAGEQTHHYLKSTEAAVRRGQAVARVLLSLRRRGFAPDVICAHPGWGEGLFVRDVFPQTPILMFTEFYFRAGEADLGFDPEFPRSPDQDFSVRIRNIPQLVSLPTANACVSPTRWQASRYPRHIRRNIQVIHDGVNTDFMCPDENDTLTIQPLTQAGESRVVAAGPPFVPAAGEIPAGPPLTLGRKDEIIVFVARNLEPYRGFHIFMRTLPDILARRPGARALIIGADGVSYSPQLPNGQSYKALYLNEIKDSLAPARVHFLGRVPYTALRAAFRIASVHVCLTYPFVLSWSTLESMACQGLLLASDTEPVREVVQHGVNGLLTDFFDRKKLADTLEAILREPRAFEPLRRMARQTIVPEYSLDLLLPRQVQLLDDLRAGKHPVPD